MSIETQAELWQQFNFEAEESADPGGGILYAIRYATEDLKAHRGNVIGALEGSGASISEIEDQLAVNLLGLGTEQRAKTILMLEELSVVNEAIEYHDAGLSCDSISELASTLKTAYYQGLTPKGMVDAYLLVSVGIPEVANDLMTAHAQNNVLSESEVREVEELHNFAARSANTLGSHNIVVIS